METKTYDTDGISLDWKIAALKSIDAIGTVPGSVEYMQAFDWAINRGYAVRIQGKPGRAMLTVSGVSFLVVAQDTSLWG